MEPVVLSVPPAEPLRPEQWIDGKEEETTETSLFLSVVTPSTVHLEPDVEECFVLDQWRSLDRDLSTFPTGCHSRNMVVGQICEP